MLFILYINLFARLQHSTNLLLELTSYLICSACLFCFKVFIIERDKLVSINLVIDKQVLYS